MGYFDEYGNYIEDEYDDMGGGMMPTQDYASQYYTPEQLLMMEQLLGQGQPSFDPQMGMDPQMTSMFGGMAMPQMDTKGRVQPFDLGVQTQLTNFGQDIGSSIGNNMMAYMSGPGAYAPGALDPVYDQKPMQVVETQKLMRMRDAGGVQGVLADFILGNPEAGRPAMNPMQAAARVKAMLQDPAGHQLDETEAAEMLMEVGTTQPQFAGAKAEPDWNSLNLIAQGIYKPWADEQALLNQPNIQQLPDGSYVQVEQRPSPQMEWLQKMGLPDPRAQYDVRYALESDPTLRGMLSSVASTQAERDMMRKEFEDRLKRMKKYREDDEKVAAEDRKRMEQYASATKQAMGDYFREMGAYGSDRARAAAQARANPATTPLPGLQSRPGTVGPPTWATATPQSIGPRSPVGSAAAAPPAWQPDASVQATMDMYDVPYDPERTGTTATVKPENYIEPMSAEEAVTAGTGTGNTISGITKPGPLVYPAKPGPAIDKAGYNPEGYSLMETLMGKPIRDISDYQKRRAVDEAITPQTAARMYMAGRRGVDKRSSSAALNYLLGLAPTVVAGRQGRSPRTDAIQQRLAPLYQIGALGQRAG